MAKVTLKVIANTLGLSTSTVSKALKNYSDINPETKLRVQKLAKDLNYTPNAFAQSLKSKGSKIIGLLVPDLVHHFFSSIINGVINEAEKHGYLVIVLQSYESYEDEKKQLKLLVDKNIDGILLSLSDKTIKYDHINSIISEGMPVVLFDKVSQLIDCPKVIIDDRKAAFDATEHLIKTGCKTIAHITGPLKPKTTIDRYMGYKKALEKYNIPFDKSLIYTSENLSYEDGYNLTSKIINDHPKLDGIFAFIDPVAIGVLNSLRDMKIKVPKQVSVIGFSNWFMCKTTSPTLTTVNQPAYEIGERAFQLLFENLNNIEQGKAITSKIVEVPTNIVFRNSTKKIID
ncbi:LacI family transcriptional regulator [Flaviramulus sp. BrNp1-15]|uniref:LacI family DNA-binding transcriptional regulator n=1 Tax=Flaviramulus sp. BrNp1-15 TaxID=2916754 RepID=UPI001EE8EF1D|nr:LacI family DNA-binding transcriptional regulator [Flaviramulus sp. BrNp1-15]ULC59063.1 LacI family transcriptional regulator [Flaviramulus sp. BrNp1-15]